MSNEYNILTEAALMIENHVPGYGSIPNQLRAISGTYAPPASVAVDHFAEFVKATRGDMSIGADIENDPDGVVRSVYAPPAAPGVPPGYAASEDEVLAYEGLKAMQRLAHKTATDAGWYVDPATGKQIERNFGEVVALMHSELSEALEADRKDLMDDKLPHRPGTEVEFADCLIRIFDTAAARGLDVAGAAIEKNRFNRDRADHKLANRNAEGGKKY